MREHEVTGEGEQTAKTRPWVVILTSHLPYHASAAWLIDEGERSEEVARRFANFVTAEIDPAVAMPLRSATDELLSWRHMVLNPEDHGIPGTELLELYSYRRGSDGDEDAAEAAAETPARYEEILRVYAPPGPTAGESRDG